MADTLPSSSRQVHANAPSLRGTLNGSSSEKCDRTAVASGKRNVNAGPKGFHVSALNRFDAMRLQVAMFEFSELFFSCVCAPPERSPLPCRCRQHDAFLVHECPVHCCRGNTELEVCSAWPALAVLTPFQTTTCGQECTAYNVISAQIWG